MIQNPATFPLANFCNPKMKRERRSSNCQSVALVKGAQLSTILGGNSSQKIAFAE